MHMEGNEKLKVLNRAQGSLIGQLAGDALGSLVEFQTPEEIQQAYPEGVLEMIDGGTWSTIAGQPTDDSEMALLLARMLAEKGTYDSDEAFKNYQYWLSTNPFDCGMTIFSALRGSPNPKSQANGALMRVSPLGVFGANFSVTQVAKWAEQDAALTHPNPICQQANALYAMAIAEAVRAGPDIKSLYDRLLCWAKEISIHPDLKRVIDQAAERPPANYLDQQGWVLIAFQNAFFQLLHAPSFEEGVVNTVMRGGDTDTNAAICGALLGAVYGKSAIPNQWLNSLANCRPEAGNYRVRRPRPKCFWPVDALELAEKLVRKLTTNKNFQI